MTLARPLRGFRFPPEVILWAVRSYLRFAVSFRDLEQMPAERDVSVDHVSLHRWVQRFAPELERRIRPRLRPVGGTRHVDGIYIRVGGAWRYLYRAVVGAGRTVVFLLSATRDAAAARRFFVRALGRGRAGAPRLVVMDRLASYRTGSVSARAKPDGASCRTSSAYAASRMASAAVARRRWSRRRRSAGTCWFRRARRRRESRSSSWLRQERPADTKPLKPRMHRVRPLMPRWSCSNPLFLWRLVRCVVRRPSVVRIARG
jgi:transposase-like protein